MWKRVLCGLISLSLQHWELVWLIPLDFSLWDGLTLGSTSGTDHPFTKYWSGMTEPGLSASIQAVLMVRILVGSFSFNLATVLSISRWFLPLLLY